MSKNDYRKLTFWALYLLAAVVTLCTIIFQAVQISQGSTGIELLNDYLSTAKIDLILSCIGFVMLLFSGVIFALSTKNKKLGNLAKVLTLLVLLYLIAIFIYFISAPNMVVTMKEEMLNFARALFVLNGLGCAALGALCTLVLRK